MLKDVLTGEVGLTAPGEALDQHGRGALGAALAVHEHLVQAAQLVLAADEVRVGAEGLRVDEERLVVGFRLGEGLGFGQGGEELGGVGGGRRRCRWVGGVG